MKEVQVLEKVKAKAKDLVLEKVDKEKALQPLGKVERVALVAVAKAKAQAKAENQVLERVRAKANPLAKAETLVEKEDNPLKVENQAKVKAKKITQQTPWKISLAICQKLNKIKSKNRLVTLLVTKPRRIMINNLTHAHRNAKTFPI